MSRSHALSPRPPELLSWSCPWTPCAPVLLRILHFPAVGLAGYLGMEDLLVGVDIPDLGIIEALGCSVAVEALVVERHPSDVAEAPSDVAGAPSIVPGAPSDVAVTPSDIAGAPSNVAGASSAPIDVAGAPKRCCRGSSVPSNAGAPSDLSNTAGAPSDVAGASSIDSLWFAGIPVCGVLPWAVPAHSR